MVLFLNYVYTSIYMTMENFRPVDGRVASLAGMERKSDAPKKMTSGIEMFDCILSEEDLSLLEDAINRNKYLGSFEVVRNILSSASDKDLDLLAQKVNDLKYSVDDVAKRSMIASILGHIDGM